MEHQCGAPVDELANLPSLGKTSAAMLVEAGIADVATLRRLGPVECYRRLRFRYGRRVTSNFIYALECAVRGIDWKSLDVARKADLKHAAREVAADLANLPSATLPSRNPS
ncbi:MAG: TfoX/Sxy family DNA transformation protein [Hyphomicrobiaceae bacterium]